jgi:hypothetical protein
VEDKAKQSNVNFTVFISGLIMEGLAALGVMKHPATQNIKKDLGHAAMVIETLDMLREKTAGNLTKEEAESMEMALHQLRVGYVAESEKEKGGKEQKSEEKESDQQQKDEK